MRENPFRIGTHVSGRYFTDRAAEVKRILGAMREPTRLLVFGPRRMGKSSAIAVASDRARRDGVLVVRADLSTASALVDVANRSIADNWGFYPATEEEGRALARDLKPVIDPDLVMIAELPDGTPIGFAITLPDLNVLLRGLDGRLLPFGWWRLLKGRKRLRQFRMWAIGVVPAFQRRAVDALLYRRLHELLTPRGPVRLEANYVLEDNLPMLNAMRNLALQPLRRYRVYEMAI